MRKSLVAWDGYNRGRLHSGCRRGTRDQSPWHPTDPTASCHNRGMDLAVELQKIYDSEINTSIS
jgi:hypothetical protein